MRRHKWDQAYLANSCLLHVCHYNAAIVSNGGKQAGSIVGEAVALVVCDVVVDDVIKVFTDLDDQNTL